MNKKYSVITYIFGDYEFPREIKEKDNNAEYILYTDNKNLKSKTWDIRYFNKFDNIFENVYYIKFHPFEFCSNDIVVVLDSSIEILKPFNFIDKFHQNYDSILIAHAERYDLLYELKIWELFRNYKHEDYIKWKNIFLNTNYLSRGQVQMSFRICNKTKITNDINDYTWKLLHEYRGNNIIERNDQIVYSYCLNHYFKNKINVIPISAKILYGNYLNTYHHNSNKKVNPLECNWDFMYRFNDTTYFMDEYIKIINIDNI